MDRPLRIGIEVQRLFRAKKHGMEVVALELIKQLQILDTYNQYILFVKNDVDSTCISETSNFKIQLISGITYADWEQFHLPIAVKKLNLDFIHSTCNTSSLFLKIPVLLTLHDIIYLEKIDFKGTSYQNFGNVYRRFIVPKIVQNSIYLITVSHFEKEKIIKKLNISSNKIKVIYNAVNPKFNNDYKQNLIDDFIQRYHLPKEFILFLGNTAPKKNTNNVIRAFIDYQLSSIEVIPLVILDYDRVLVENMLNDLGHSALIDRFLFPGYIKSDEMPLMYNAATVFLYPSLRESFGLPILEAMACGTPVITSTTSSMPEVAGNAAILVDPFQHQHISEALSRLMNDDLLRRDLKRKGIDRASSFTWAAAAKSLLDIYKALPLSDINY